MAIENNTVAYYRIISQNFDIIENVNWQNYL